MEIKHTELIDQYLSGKLKGKQLADFEEQLKTDNHLRIELELEKELRQVIQDNESLSFREELVCIRNEMKKGKKKSEKKITLRNSKWYLMAASAIILIVSAYYIFIYSQPLSNRELYTQYYEKYPSNITERSEEIEPTNYLMMGMAKYNENKFVEAQRYITEAIENNQTNDTGFFFLGLSYMETKQFDKAMESFELLLDLNNSLFSEQAKWYMVLCLLQTSDNKNNQDIIQLLHQITDLQGDRYHEAKDLLNKLQ